MIAVSKETETGACLACEIFLLVICFLHLKLSPVMSLSIRVRIVLPGGVQQSFFQSMFAELLTAVGNFL